MIDTYFGSPVMQYQYMNVTLSFLCVVMFLNAIRFDVQQLSGYAILCALINFTIGVVLNEITLKASQETINVTISFEVYHALICTQITLGILSGLFLFYAYFIHRN